MSVDPMLTLTGVSKSYTGAERLNILKEASLTVYRGESVAIVGPSGSGKTTVLNILGTLDLPDAGSVTLGGLELTRLTSKELARTRNQKIGFVFQQHHLLPQCSVWENVLLPCLAFTRKSSDSADERALRLLKRVGLAERLDHLPGQLSGGERQRVAVVRALIQQPSLLLADEPTGALDRHSAAEIGRLLVELNQEEGVTLITVTHSPELAALMGRTVTLADGKLVPAV
jgi:lipoprotein-releasing system ATP-binding protein